MKFILWIFLAVLISSNGCAQNKSTTEKPAESKTSIAEDSFVLLELFTSQGCSSCPPADKNLSELVKEYSARNMKVYALAFHVDYWNRLGWKDPFSSTQATDRQSMYSRLLNLNNIYTPQMVINGEKEFVGSNRKAAISAIDMFLSRKTTHSIIMAIPGTTDGKIESVAYQLEGDISDMTLYAAITQNGKQTEIPRGENKGKTLHNDHVVLWLDNIEAKASGSITLPIEYRNAGNNSELVVFLQSNKTGKISAAQSIRL